CYLVTRQGTDVGSARQRAEPLPPRSAGGVPPWLHIGGCSTARADVRRGGFSWCQHDARDAGGNDRIVRRILGRNRGRPRAAAPGLSRASGRPETGGARRGAGSAVTVCVGGAA